LEIDGRLTEVLSEFARTLVTDFPIQGILDHLVVRIADVLPVDAAGVTLISPGTDPHYVAASSESALRFEQLQTEVGEGPCLAAYNSGAPVAVPDLREDDRFPSFGPRALAAGLVAVFTFPLRQDDHQLGALDLYRTTAGPLDTKAMAAAQTLADVAAAYLVNAQARADLQESSDRTRHSSLHDALTGLPNRVLLFQRLDHAILRCRRSGTTVAILFADIDLFKAVNDAYGHHAGDELLVAAAARLTAALRPGDTLARLAGDEFVILCEDLDDASQVEPLAARIGAAFAQPFVLSSAEVQISVSVGIAFAGRGDELSEQVLEDADAAMYQAKRKGGARHGILDLREQRLAKHRAGLNRDLRGALTRGELRTEYQPIVTAVDGHIAGVEALLRWIHPVLGTVAPATSIPLAEESGLMSEIGRWVLEQTCSDLRHWQRHPHHRRFEIAVNVSTQQIMAAGFATTVGEVLSASSVDPALVTLEVTESVFVQDSERALVVLNDLKEIGVLLALDDFGTGYSSLSYLNQFPVDVVKIDQVFIADLHRHPGRLMVSAVVGLAHGLGMKVVAEGVEFSEQYDQVATLDCDAYQGFYFARPMLCDDLDRLLALDDDLAAAGPFSPAGRPIRA
jgi:diguanylate cyclase (GGDEF)-like protein